MVNHEKLFAVLRKRQLCFVFIRVLRAWYSNQAFVVKWGSAMSKSFGTSNGTRQGSVLSPYLFNVYIDELSDRLKSTGIGCYMNNVYFNHLFYADDSVLIAPSPRALQLLIDTCCQFSLDFHLKYNLKKTKYVYVTSLLRKDLVCPPFFFNGYQINSVFNQPYLGYYINSEMCDDDAVNDVIKSMYIRGNMLARKFSNCSDNVKIKLFQSYCSNFYCSTLWSNDNPDLIQRVKVCHNNILRSCIATKFKDSISSHFVYRNIPNFDVLRRKSIWNLYYSLLSSKNSLLSTIVTSVFFTYSDFLKNWKIIFN